jgi:phage/plasmid-like protein (TIGR03299 family)
MAHGITIRETGKVEMAFSGDTPWHGLGQKVTQGASIGVWKKESGLDWSASESGVQFLAPLGGKDRLLDVPESKVLYRSDTQAPLSIVGSEYNVVQPGEVLEFFRDMTEHEGWHIHTAGSLKGGRKIWALATNGDAASVGRGDVVCRNLLLATSLDGSMKTWVGETSVRVVCANTLAYALDAGSTNSVQVSHRSVFDEAAVKQQLKLSPASFKAFIAQAREMAETPINLKDAQAALLRIFSLELEKEVKAKTHWLSDAFVVGMPAEQELKNKAVQGIVDLWQGDGLGSNLATAKGTRWGLLNAVTQQVDHSRSRTQDTRLDSAWFGRGRGIKERAFEELSV